MVGEIIGLLLGAFLPLMMWFFDRKKNDKRTKLEIENLLLQNENLKRDNLKVKEAKKEVEQKLLFLDRILELEFINELALAVDNMFEATKADRFLIMIAKNGKKDFNIVNVVFEQHKDRKFRINAIARYRNVHIDAAYKNMLKEAEFRGAVDITTSDMEESLLKSFYKGEGVTHSMVRHLARKPIDEHNDFLLFSSIATHEKDGFTDVECAFIKTQYEGTILPALQKIVQ